MASTRTTHLLLRFIASPPCHSASCINSRLFLRTTTRAKVNPERLLSARRSFSTSWAVRAATPAPSLGQPTELLAYPTLETLAQPEDPDEPEVELIPLEEATIEVTERAAEVCDFVLHLHDLSEC